MTIAELIRLVDSKKRTQEREAREKAAADYKLADLIGRSISRIYSSSAQYPSIADAYPNLFTQEEVEEKLQAKRDELSVLRFKQFTQFHNNKYKEGGKKIE